MFSSVLGVFRHVASLCLKCFSCFICIFQVFHMDVAKVDQDVAYVASVSEACCKRLFKMVHLSQTYVASVFYLDVARVSHICCKSMFEVFQLFPSYVVFSCCKLQVFYLDVAYVSHICCKCMF